jgi:hypothetical protein
VTCELQVDHPGRSEAPQQPLSYLGFHHQHTTLCVTMQPSCDNQVHIILPQPDDQSKATQLTLGAGRAKQQPGGTSRQLQAADYHHLQKAENQTVKHQ